MTIYINLHAWSDNILLNKIVTELLCKLEKLYFQFKAFVAGIILRSFEIIRIIYFTK